MKISEILTILKGYDLTAKTFRDDVQVTGSVAEIKRLIESGDLTGYRAVSCNGGSLADIGVREKPLPCSCAIVGACHETACYGVYLLFVDRKLFLKPTGIGRRVR